MWKNSRKFGIWAVFKCQLCRFVSLWLWTSFLNTLSFNFLNCKLSATIHVFEGCCVDEWVWQHVATCLASGKPQINGNYSYSQWLGREKSCHYGSPPLLPPQWCSHSFMFLHLGFLFTLCCSSGIILFNYFWCIFTVFQIQLLWVSFIFFCDTVSKRLWEESYWKTNWRLDPRWQRS